MGRILEQLYAGELCPADRVIRGNAEYDAMCSTSLKECDRFAEKLDEELHREFELLMEPCLELTYLEKTQTFSDGFRIGAGIMSEVLQENNREYI